MKKVTFCLYLVTLVVTLVSVDTYAQLLIRRKIFSSPETWVMNKSFSNSQWGKDVYCQVYSSALASAADDKIALTGHFSLDKPVAGGVSYH